MPKQYFLVIDVILTTVLTSTVMSAVMFYFLRYLLKRNINERNTQVRKRQNEILQKLEEQKKLVDNFFKEVKKIRAKRG